MNMNMNKNNNKYLSLSLSSFLIFWTLWNCSFFIAENNFGFVWDSMSFGFVYTVFCLPLGQWNLFKGLKIIYPMPKDIAKFYKMARSRTVAPRLT